MPPTTQKTKLSIDDVFILGAGFSKAVSDKFPTIKDLSQDIVQRLKDQGLTPFNDPFVERLVGVNFEHALTYLSTSQPWLNPYRNHRNVADFEDMRDSLAMYFHEKCGEFQLVFLWDSRNDNHWLRDIVKYWDSRKSTVITFNYDTIVEQTALNTLRGGFAVEDFYSASIPRLPQAETQRAGSNPRDTFKLLKLHGSINWFYSGATPFRGQTVYCDDLFFNDRVSQEKGKNTKAVKDRNAYLAGKKTLLAPFTVNKSPFVDHEMFDHLWSRAGSSIAKAKRIIFWGYSLPVTDLSVINFVSEHAQEDCELVLVNWDAGIEEKYKGIFSEISPNFTYKSFSGVNHVKDFLDTYDISV